MGGGGFNTAPVPAASYIAAPAMLMDESQTEEGVTLKMYDLLSECVEFFEG